MFGLNLGGNVFGWTADRETSFTVLDTYVEAGGDFVDTADVYSAWVDAHSGGESESVIGDWMAARGNRDRVVVATKVGQFPTLRGLGATTVTAAVEASLRRLRTDRVDLLYAHIDDQHTPLEETLGAFDALVRAGKVRYLGASNYSAARLSEALAVADREGFARYVAVQPSYNLIDRNPYERELADLVAREGLGTLPYFGLARGFLTGKYRPNGPEVSSPRAASAMTHMDDKGLAVLAALDKVAAAHDTTQAAVALAWLLAQPTVVAPIASARTPAQLKDLLPMATLRLSQDELDALTTASN